MGWLQILGNLASSGAQGIDRYQALRQLDQANQLKLRQQAMAEAKAQQDAEMENRQQQLLDLALLKQKQDMFSNLHNPGELSPEDAQQAKNIGLSSLLKPIMQGQSINPSSVNVGLPASLGGVGNQNPVTFNETPTDRYAFTGMPLQQENDKAKAIQQQLQLANAGHVQLQNDEAAMRLNLIKQMLPPVGPQPSDNISNAPFGGLNLDKPLDPSNITPRQAFLVKTLFGENPSQIVAKPDSVQPVLLKGPNGPYYADARTQQPLFGGAAAYEKPQQAQTYSPDAIQGMVNFYQSTGMPPALGMGGVAGRDAFWRAANDIQQSPGGAPFNPGFTKAQVAADSASLKNLTTMSDAIDTFHDVVVKNAKVLEGAFSKLNDYGAAAWNTPARELGKQFSDPSGNIAGAQAAALTVLREYARLTNNPTLKGQLTEGARTEAENMLKNGFTMAQFYNVYGIMKQDMANVQTSIMAGKQRIQQRMQNGQGQTLPNSGSNNNNNNNNNDPERLF